MRPTRHRAKVERLAGLSTMPATAPTTSASPDDTDADPASVLEHADALLYHIPLQGATAACTRGRLQHWVLASPRQDIGDPVAHPLFHARSSARKYGGIPGDYQAIHDWFDESKAYLADARHRALRHHAEGIFLCERIFGTSIVNSDGREVPVRVIGEQHVLEDLGRIPTASDWLREISLQPWMAARSQLQALEPTTGSSSTGRNNSLRHASQPSRADLSNGKM